MSLKDLVVPKHYKTHKNTILMLGPIDVGVVGAVMPLLFEVDKEKTAEGIRLRICSPGGEAPASLALYDALKLCQNRITIEAFGECSSAASLLLQAASPGRRWMSPYCKMLIHNGATDIDVEGITSHELLGNGHELARLDRIIHTILSECSGVPIQEMEKLCKNETVLTAKQAVDLGLADWVIVK